MEETDWGPFLQELLFVLDEVEGKNTVPCKLYKSTLFCLMSLKLEVLIMNRRFRLDSVPSIL